MRLLFWTLKLEYHLERPKTNPYHAANDECYIYCLWHEAILIATFGGKHQNSSALTSRHTDGSFVAEILKLVGVSPIRGSTNRITPAAVREIFRTAQSKNIVIAPDGPRGPNRQMSAGIVHIASHTGRGIVPTAYSCSNYWTVKGSWSNLIIPKPFSRVHLVAGKPVYVPADLRSDARREYMAVVQDEMDRLATLADSLVALAPRFRTEQPFAKPAAEESVSMNK